LNSFNIYSFIYVRYINISYIDKGIDIETIQTIIKHSTCCQPFQAFQFFWGE